MLRVKSIDGLDQVEFNYEYRGDAEEIIFAQSFPLLSFCFLNGCEVTLSGEGVKVSNSGGCICDTIKNPENNTAQGTKSGADLDAFLRLEEISAARAYLERYPKHRPSVFGESFEATTEGETTSPEPPPFAFSRAFPAVAGALVAGDGARVVLSLSQKQGPCILHRPGCDKVVITASDDKKTIRGFLNTLETQLVA